MASKESLRERYKAIGTKKQYNSVRMSKDLVELIGFIDAAIKK